MLLIIRKINLFQKFYFIAIGYILIFIIFSISAFAKTITVENVVVTKVIDGDTIWVKINNKSKKVRLLGINAPEISTNPTEFYGYEATEQLKTLLNNKIITISYDDEYQYDKYKRILANIYLKQKNNNTLWINNFMIENGLAVVYIIQDTPMPNLETLRKSENKAINNKLGLWQLESNLPITPQMAEQNLNQYKIVNGTILSIYTAKKSLWLQMEPSKQTGFSIRIDKKLLPTIKQHYDVEKLIGKKVMISGFINKYSPKFGAFIDLKNPLALTINAE